MTLPCRLLWEIQKNKLKPLKSVISKTFKSFFIFKFNLRFFKFILSIMIYPIIGR